jgi:hypothetical protein
MMCSSDSVDDRFDSTSSSEDHVSRRKSYSMEPVYAPVDDADFEGRRLSTEEVPPYSAGRREKKERSGAESLETAIDSDSSSDDLQTQPRWHESTPMRKSGSDTDDGFMASDDDWIAGPPASDDSDPEDLDELLRKYGVANDDSEFADSDDE